MNNVDGYTAADPLDDEDWEDVVRWEVNGNMRERHGHDRNGYMCEVAGSHECLKLGHEPHPEEGWADGELHEYGWSGEILCPATKNGEACTECEASADDCGYQPPDVRAFWNLFTAKDVAA